MASQCLRLSQETRSRQRCDLPTSSPPFHPHLAFLTSRCTQPQPSQLPPPEAPSKRPLALHTGLEVQPRRRTNICRRTVHPAASLGGLGKQAGVPRKPPESHHKAGRLRELLLPPQRKLLIKPRSCHPSLRHPSLCHQNHGPTTTLFQPPGAFHLVLSPLAQ